MKNRQAGFTLVEAVVGMAIMVMIMGGLAEMLMTFMGQGGREINRTDRQQQARFVIGMVAQDVRYSATPFSITAGANALDFYKNSNGVKEEVLYSIIKDTGSGNNVLTRTVTFPDKSTKVNPLFDPSRYYMNPTDFAVTLTTGSTTVNGVAATFVDEVAIVIKLRQLSTDPNQDPNPVTVQTNVYLLNAPTTK